MPLPLSRSSRHVAPHDPVVEDRPGRAGEGGRGVRAVLGAHEPAAVGVAEQDVVVLGQEPGRGGRVRVGSGGVGQVEQLAAPLVPERPQVRPEAVDDLPEPGEP